LDVSLEFVSQVIAPTHVNNYCKLVKENKESIELSSSECGGGLNLNKISAPNKEGWHLTCIRAFSSSAQYVIIQSKIG
jgi:hypothetical protein